MESLSQARVNKNTRLNDKMKLQKYTKQLKKGIFYEAFNLVKKKPKLFFLTLLMDACFLLAIFTVGKLANLAVPGLLKMNPADIIVSMFFYILIIILIYSFTKFYALHFIKNMLKKAKSKLGNVSWFFLLNIICLVFLLAVFLLLNGLIMAGIREAYTKWAARLFVLFMSLLVFSFISIAHSLFALDLRFKDVLKKSFKFTFGRIKGYYGVFVANLIVFGVFFGFYFGLWSLLNAILTVDVNRFNVLFTWLGAILLYLMQAYNRLYFYLVVKHINR